MKKTLAALLVVAMLVIPMAPAAAVELNIKGNAGYFHTFGGDTFRGIAIKFAEKQMWGLPFTFSMAGIEESTDIGDLDSSLVVSTSIQKFFEKAGFKYTFPEQVEIGLFYSRAQGEDKAGIFFAIGYEF